MASEKISAMPAATDSANADLVTVVQGGVNKKTTRPILFTVKAGESIQFQLPDGSSFDLLDDGTMQFNSATGSLIGIEPDGTINLSATGGTNTRIDGDKITLAQLPTADPHVANQLYSLAGVVKISAG